MVARVSAGLLLFRRRNNPDAAGGPAPTGGVEAASRPEARGLEVLIALPGGPFFARRDDGWWSVPKGEHEPEEEALSAASREFAEELGSPPPGGERIDLGSVTQRGGKLVHVWAVEGDLDTSTVVSNEFELEWPPRSGSLRRFPEIARAEWVSAAQARRKLLPAQVPFVDRLEALLRERDGP